MEKTSFSDEYIQFWGIRGSKPHESTYSKPITDRELAEASRVTLLIISLLQDLNFEKIRSNLKGLSTALIRAGVITEENHMSIVREFEVLTDGQTTEQLIASLNKE